MALGQTLTLQIGTKPNKNLERLIEAVAGLSCRLDIVGPLSPKHLELLDRHRVDFDNAVGLSLEEVVSKYQESDVVAFASTYEGFGMPIVEANATETPIVTSNLLSMPEVGADAACYVDPFSVESIREGIVKVIEDDSYRIQLVEKGKVNRLRFSPEAIAAQYASVYERVVSGKRR
jgi:glycosyltransferase involved in cell wall biosynthesis